MYVIVKMIPNEHGVDMPVIILNGFHEILEFNNQEEADNMRNIFQENSDSGYQYVVKKMH